jgi:hypothetical protein
MQVAARAAFGMGRPLAQSRARGAYELLSFGLAALSIVFGFDKFFGFLGVEWAPYVAPAFERYGSDQQVAMAFGAFQIVIGFVVFVRARLGAWLVLASWCGVVVNALLAGTGDLALHALTLTAAAAALVLLARRYGTDFMDTPAISGIDAG